MLGPGDRLARRLASTAGSSPAVEIVDLGFPYRVVAAGRVREYRDEARDCAHRARVAAVFIALSLDPAEIITDPPAKETVVEAPVPVVVAPLAASPGGGRLMHLEASGALEIGFNPAGSLVTHPGLALRMAIGRGTLAVVLGVTVLQSVDISVGDRSVRQGRMLAELGVRIRSGGDLLATYVELGGIAARMAQRGLDLTANASSTAVEVGLFATAGVRFLARRRVGPFVEVHTELVPRPSEIQAFPVVGHTPTLWLGARAGVSLDF